MAQHTSGSITDIVALVGAIQALCASDGWTVDYSTTGRVHLSKSGYHYEVFSSDSSIIAMIGCTGYAAGQPPASQPGASPSALTHALFSGGNTTYYEIISTGTAVFVCLSRYTSGAGYGNGCAFGVISEKIGSWAGGQFVMPGQGVALAGHYFLFSATSLGHIMIDGQWAPNVSYGYGCGLYAANIALRNKMPSLFNAGILTLPITIYLRNASSATLYHPIGYAPNLFAVRGGDVYLPGETIQIGGVTHLFVVDHPTVSAVAGLLVKMVA